MEHLNVFDGRNFDRGLDGLSRSECSISDTNAAVQKLFWQNCSRILRLQVKGARVELNSAFGIREASRYNIESLFCVSL